VAAGKLIRPALCPSSNFYMEQAGALKCGLLPESVGIAFLRGYKTSLGIQQPRSEAIDHDPKYAEKILFLIFVCKLMDALAYIAAA